MSTTQIIATACSIVGVAFFALGPILARSFPNSKWNTLYEAFPAWLFIVGGSLLGIGIILFTA